MNKQLLKQKPPTQNDGDMPKSMWKLKERTPITKAVTIGSTTTIK